VVLILYKINNLLYIKYLKGKFPLPADMGLAASRNFFITAHPQWILKLNCENKIYNYVSIGLIKISFPEIDLSKWVDLDFQVRTELSD